MPTVKQFDARFQGKERLIADLEEVRKVIMSEQDLTKAANKLTDTLQYLRNRDILIGYSYNDEKSSNESVSDGEDEMEAGISASERAAVNRAENQY